MLDRRIARWSPLMTKMTLVGALVFALLIPIAWIRGLVAEREARHAGVKQELMETWGGRQTLAGPILSVPYREHWKTKDDAGTNRVCCAYFFPERLEVEGEVTPEVRSRSIFDLIVYRVVLRARGSFARPDFSSWRIAPEDVLWNEASLSVGISALRGVAAQPGLLWDGQTLAFQPGAGEVNLYPSGMHVALPNLGTVEHLAFAFDLTLAGSEGLTFLPVGRETEVTLSSTWPDPSFAGGFLPTERVVDGRGFRAVWKVSAFARSWPQSWRRSDNLSSDLQNHLWASAFGVRLLDPVDFYRQSDRAVKYAMLFVVLTFLTFALFEILRGLRVHPMQYLLVGFAMCLFYLILLAASEQIGFGAAYVAASVATMALVVGYATRVLGHARRGGAMGVMLAGLYGYLYVLLQLEDYALLLGTVGLFAILAAVMYLTRNLDWYAIDLAGAKVPSAEPTR